MTQGKRKYYSRKFYEGEGLPPLPPEVEYSALWNLRKMLKYYGAKRKVRLVEERMEKILECIDLNYDDLQKNLP